MATHISGGTRKEARIAINGVPLTDAQSLVVRVAINEFRNSVFEEGLDSHPTNPHYYRHALSILDLIFSDLPGSGPMDESEMVAE